MLGRHSRRADLPTALLSLLVPLLIACAGWWAAPSVLLDLGGNLDARYVEGFFAAEGSGAASGRWSAPASWLRVPAPNLPATLTMRLAFAPTIRYAALSVPGGVVGLPSTDDPANPGVQAIRYPRLFIASDQRWGGEIGVRFDTEQIASEADPRTLGVFVQTSVVRALAERSLLPPLLPLLALLLLTALAVALLLLANTPGWLALLVAAVAGGALAWAWGWQRLWVEPYLWPLSIGLAWAVAPLWLARRAQPAATPAMIIGLALIQALGLLLWVFAKDNWVALWSWRGLPLVLLPLALLLIESGRRRAVGLRWTLLLSLGVLAIFAVYSYASLWDRDWASDFAPLFRGPRAAWRGEALYRLDELAANPFGPVYKYPPFFALVMGPFTLLSPGPAFQLWKAFQVALVLVSAYLLWIAVSGELRRWSTLWLVLLLALFQPIIDTIRYGQVDALLLVLLAGGLWALRQPDDQQERSWRWWLYGALLAVATLIKLYPAYLLLLPLLRRRTAALWGFGGGLALLGGLSVALLGPAVHLEYIREVLPLSGGGTAWIENQTINGFLNRLHTLTALPLAPAGDETVIWLTYAAALALTGLALWWCRALPDDLAYALLIVTMLMILPASWIHYQTILLIPLYVVMVAVERRGSLPWSRAVPLALACGLLYFGNQWAFYGRTLYGPFWQLILSYKLYGLLLLFAAIGPPLRVRRAQPASAPQPIMASTVRT